MAIKFIPIKCPECDADLDIEEGRKVMFCSYCGRKIVMVDENEFKYNVTHRHVDVAKIREVEEKAEIKKVRERLKKEKIDKVIEFAEMVLLALLALTLFAFMFIDSILH